MNPLILASTKVAPSSGEPAQQYTIGPSEANIPNQNMLLIHGSGPTSAPTNSVYPATGGSYPISYSTTGSPAPQQGSMEPSGPNWSWYFPSTTYQALLGSGTAINTGAFTIEFFINMQVLQNSSNYDYAVLSTATSTTNLNYSWCVVVNNSNWNTGQYQIQWLANGTNSTTQGCTFTCPTLLVPGEWYHVCVQRSGNVIYFNINGVFVASFTEPTGTALNLSASTNTIIGSNSNTGWGLSSIQGHLSNLRFVTGANVYAVGQNFTVPTSPLGIAGSGYTTLLTCQNPWFMDNGQHAYNVMQLAGANGGIQIHPYGPFNNAQKATSTVGGALFTGSNSLSPAGRNGFDGEDVSAMPWLNYNPLIAVWLYPTQMPSGTATIMSSWSGTTNAYAMGYTGSGQLVFQYKNTAGTATTKTTAVAAYVISPNCWNLVVMSRSGSSVYCSINGKAQTTLPITGTINTPNVAPNVGGPDASLGWNGHVGYMSEFQFNKTTGSAWSTNTFIPSVGSGTNLNNYTFQSGNFGNAWPEWNNCAGVIDYAYASSLTFTGNVQTSTAKQLPFSSAPSIYCDGSGHIMATSPLYANHFNNTNWTIEGFFYPTQNTSGTTYGLFGSGASATSNGPVTITVTNGIVQVTVYSGPNTINATITGFKPINANAWNHIALVKAGAIIALYINGQQHGTASPTNDVTAGNNLYVGGSMATYSGNNSPFVGYIQEFRFTKANVYTGQTYAVPSVPFANT